jgi:hypothetical protein
MTLSAFGMNLHAATTADGPGPQARGPSLQTRHWTRGPGELVIAEAGEAAVAEQAILVPRIVPSPAHAH